MPDEVVDDAMREILRRPSNTAEEEKERARSLVERVRAESQSKKTARDAVAANPPRMDEVKAFLVEVIRDHTPHLRQRVDDVADPVERSAWIAVSQSQPPPMPTEGADLDIIERHIDEKWPGLPESDISDALDKLKREQKVERKQVTILVDLPVDVWTVAAPSHSQGFRSVCWWGTDYSFTPNQAAVVKQLWEAWENGTPEVGDPTLLETAGIEDSQRLRDVFKERGGRHPAWGTMIIKGRTKGTHRLRDFREPLPDSRSSE